MKNVLFSLCLLLAAVSLGAQQTVVTCPTGQRPLSTVNGQAATVICEVVPPTEPPPTTSAPVIAEFRASTSQITVGQSVTFAWTVTGQPVPTLRLNQGIGVVTGTSYVWTPTVTGARVVTLTATNTVGSVSRSWTVTVNPVVVPPPPPPTEPPPATNIWPARVTDPIVLGQCSPEEHDRNLVNGGDGFRYYTWHPPSGSDGCRYAHEHGGDPAPVVKALLTAVDGHVATGRYSASQGASMRELIQAPLLMGRVARLMPMPGEPNGHVEPHEGFKVFYAYNNEQNDEGRRSLITALFLTHMGTGGVGRFTMPHHSSIGRQIHRDGPAQLTELMVDFGTANTVCNPRVSPTRDFIAILTSPCGIDSPYEIWTGTARVANIARQLVTPAVFDPITVMNRSNPSELVYAWDPRVLVTRNHDGDSWAGFRGCDRESYAQMPIYSVGGFSDTLTSADGQSAGPLRQILYSQQASADIRGSDDGNFAFKIRRNHCVTGLGLKN